MKKIICIFSVILLLQAFVQPVEAADELHWYCIRNKANRQPPCPAEFSFISQHGGIFLDSAHGDTAQERVVYLTFDAGYENGNVARVLDALKEADAPAAFFVLKHFVKANGDLIERMLCEGHLVCNHTANHKNLARLSKAQTEQEIRELEDVFREQTGRELSHFFRPPEGSFSAEMLETVAEMGYKTVFWSLAYADWDNQNQPAPQKAMEILMTNIHNGAILLLHPTSKTNADILPRLIGELRAAGYRLGSLEEICAA